jgi:RHS repeat-associated protein
VTAVQGDGWSERYAYDSAGRSTGAHGARYVHDAQGRVVLRQCKRLSAPPRTWRYRWSAEDRLVAIRTPEGHDWRYRYDAFGRRIAKQRLGADGTVAEQVDFTWDGDVLAEQASDRQELRWDWVPGTVRPVTQTAVRRDLTQDEVDERFHAIVTDLVGTPTELVRPDGTVDRQPAAALWGGTTSGPAICPLRFPGQYADDETGLHYNHQRYYDPQTARYASPDPLGLDGGPDPHAYVPNPLTWLDPLGLAACTPAAARYTRRSASHVYSHGHAANAPRLPGKSRFRVTEGGQKFTDEVLGHPSVSTTFQFNGRIRYDVRDLGRGPVGWNRFGAPTNGGRVIVEGPKPQWWSKYLPGEVVTQFPL